MLWGGRRGNSHHRRRIEPMECSPCQSPNDLSRSPVALDENTTLIAVIEMGLASRLIAGRVPGVNRRPLQKLNPDPEALLTRLHRWREEAIQAGRLITRIA